MAVYKERVSVTLTRPYLNFMARLHKDGLYLTRASAMMAALRLLAKEHGIPLIPVEEEA